MGFVQVGEMKDYYTIMEVSRTASEADIKRSFRRLANLYHPDKNQSLEAESLFKELNEAYEVLSDPVLRSEYDQKFSNPRFSYEQARSAPQTSYKRGPSEKQMFQASLLRYSRLLFYFGWLWCAVLAVDYLAPEQRLDAHVIDSGGHGRVTGMNRPRNPLITEEGYSFNIDIGELRHFPPQSEMHIYRSSLLSALIRVENSDGSFVVNNLATIYRNFAFAPIMLFLGCMVGILIKGGIEFHINLGIVVFLLMVLNIVLLYTSRI